MRGNTHSRGRGREWPKLCRSEEKAVEDYEAISRRFPRKRSPVGNGTAMLSTSLRLPIVGWSSDGSSLETGLLKVRCTSQRWGIVLQQKWQPGAIATHSPPPVKPLRNGGLHVPPRPPPRPCPLVMLTPFPESPSPLATSHILDHIDAHTSRSSVVTSTLVDFGCGEFASGKYVTSISSGNLTDQSIIRRGFIYSIQDDT